jgi:hypothetical protein
VIAAETRDEVHARGLSIAGVLASVVLGAAEGRAEAIVPAMPWLRLGDCALENDPTTAAGEEEASGLTCVKGGGGAEVTLVANHPRDNLWLRYARGYAGYHPTTWATLHLRAHYLQLMPLGSDVTAEGRDADLDMAAVELGNVALDQVRLTAGRVTLPFGIDASEANEFYRLREHRPFWSSPEYGAFVTLDDLTDVSLAFGYATDRYASAHKRRLTERAAGLHDPRRGRSASDEEADAAADADAGAALDDETRPMPREAMSVRLMLDFSALDGSRLVLSGYGESAGMRRLGAGFVTVNRRGDVTHFEWVRRLTTPDGKEDPFEQVLRIAYTSNWRADSRWIVEFDDERFVQRAGTIGGEAMLAPHLVLRLAASYLHAETGTDKAQWALTSGLEARL